jgi:hypothetical protein
MKIGILEHAEDPSLVRPTPFRTKSYALRVVNKGLAHWVGKTVIQLVDGIHRSGLGQFVADLVDEVWRPTFTIRFDPSLRESPGLRYPLLLARRQQSFAYLEAAYA